jgi:Protein of unknown function (DUF3563)
MRTNSPALYDSSLAAILARLTHSILQDANDRAQDKSSPAANAPSSSFATSVASAVGTPRSWLERLDTWFWKQDMKHREAFLSRSTDIFDLEQRMRCLERGDKWLGTDGTDATN